LNNAIKYTQHGGIKLTLDQVDIEGRAYYSISVADTGIGISAKNVTTIYEAFRQESEGYNRAFEGTGLGLHITRRYIDLLGGFIDLESEPGVGSVFTIFIPKNENDSQAAGNTTGISNKNTEIAGKEDKLLKVLYVEDDADHREFVCIFLKDLYEINTAFDGPTSIRLCNEKMYDIILMDINLGHKMNGLEAMKEIRKIPGYQNTPIAAVTANAMVAQKNEFLSEGCTHYLSKPFNKKKLVEFLETMKSV
jgi:CheY-like chemotaxis protein